MINKTSIAIKIYLRIWIFLKKINNEKIDIIIF